MERSLTTPSSGQLPKKLLESAERRPVISAGETRSAARISSVVSRESMSTPNILIHCEGSAAPQVWPMPRPPKVPMDREVQADSSGVRREHS